MSDASDEDVMVITDLSETSNSEKPKTNRSRSIVWQHFTKLEKKFGSREECQCNHCKKTFACSNRSGTSHLLRHITRGTCPCFKIERVRKLQKLASFVNGRSLENGNNIVPWTLDQELIQTPTQQSNFVKDELLPERIEGLVHPTCNSYPDDYEAQPISACRQLHQVPPTSKFEPRDESHMRVGKLAVISNDRNPRENTTKALEIVTTTDYSLAAALKCLNEMEDIPQSSAMYLDAFEILKDADEREAFICLNPEPRRRWLQRLLNRQYPSRYSYDI